MGGDEGEIGAIELRRIGRYVVGRAAGAGGVLDQHTEFALQRHEIALDVQPPGQHHKAVARKPLAQFGAAARVDRHDGAAASAATASCHGTAGESSISRAAEPRFAIVSRIDTCGSKSPWSCG